MRFLILSVLWALTTAQNISDPVEELVPIMPKLKDVMDMELDAEDLNEGNIGLDRDTSNKRDVEDNQVSFNEDRILNPDTQDDESSRRGRCAYTFVVPQTVPTNSHICVNGNNENEEDGITLLQMYRQVMSAKLTVEDTRNAIIEERQQYPSAREVQRMQTDVDMLKQQSRNSQEGISQLYTQLMHEIINKRDNSLEFAQLKNKLLNRTVLHYELQDKHNQLLAEHTALKGVVNRQSEQIESLRRAMAELANSRTPERTENVQATQPHTIQDPMLVVERRPNTAEANSRPSRNHIRGPITVLPTTPTTSAPWRPPPGRYRDCTEVQRAGYTESGVYNLRIPTVAKRIKVWCDLNQDPGGWITIQRRSEGRVNFYRDMASYKRGFGKLRGDFWLGLENIHKLTSQPTVNFKLHIDLEDWGGKKTFVEYRSFRVDSEETGYRLRIAHYSGNAGDSLTWHNNMRFTTFDADNDPFPRNCADFQRGGWWYNMCAHSNLNGVYYKGGHYRSQYQDGIYWSEWRGGSYSLKEVSMKIRPIE
uniref:angiopoietin-related protein 2-like isoform X1 n=1 Tax=Ciona intestinalis TaxID=7719 RepID=UPI000180D183|nr:angiopoietin-related protein 2-like isoform X1 [Ciona intestinalis]|eukprot:XP_009859743.2 angiopoietin-related protein 2-like isoform X1 [Ciona intestinalis]